MYMAHINMKGGSWASQCKPHCLLATQSFSSQSFCLWLGALRSVFPWLLYRNPSQRILGTQLISLLLKQPQNSQASPQTTRRVSAYSVTAGCLIWP